MIISLPFCHRSRHLLYALKISQKLISLLVSVLLLDSFTDPSPADISAGSSGGSTDLLTCFLCHQFSLKCELLGTEHSLNKHACWVFAVGLPEKQQEIILRFRAGWKGLWRLHLYVWKSCCGIGPVRKWVQRMIFTLHPNMATQRHPTVSCWSWFEFNKTLEILSFCCFDIFMLPFKTSYTDSW